MMIPSDPVERISAVTLHTSDMSRAVAFYERLGFRPLYGGPDAEFTSFQVGDGFLNLQHRPLSESRRGWGRLIFWVTDVDAMYARVMAAGYTPATQPADAAWGERYFHIEDPDGHELSFARPR
jgi:catechol 2,3-dioxygenase-like lactoylglutathione lyase family enzyme